MLLSERRTEKISKKVYGIFFMFSKIKIYGFIDYRERI
jgi:hypothetical protein